MTEIAEPSTAPRARARPDRRAAARPSSRSRSSTARSSSAWPPARRARLAASPIGSPRSSAFEALPVETQPALHAVHRPARRAPRRRGAVLARAPRPRRPPAALPEGVGRPARAARGRRRRRARCRATAARGRRPRSTTVAELLRDATRRAARELLEGGAALPADDKFAQLTRALWTQGVVLDVPAGVRLERPIVVRWVARGARPRAHRRARSSRLGDGAEASLRRGARASDESPAAGGGQSLLRRHDGGRARARREPRRSPASRSSARDQVAFQQRRADIGEAADAPLGARPARRPARPLPRRQPPRRRPELGRAGRDRVRRRATSCST